MQLSEAIIQRTSFALTATTITKKFACRQLPMVLKRKASLIMLQRWMKYEMIIKVICNKDKINSYTFLDFRFGERTGRTVSDILCVISSVSPNRLRKELQPIDSKRHNGETKAETEKIEINNKPSVLV